MAARLTEQLVTLAVNVEDFDFAVLAKVFAQLGDVDVHAPGIEIVVVDPDRLEGEVTFQHLILVPAEKLKELRLLGGQLA
jgi:hypothetical protein